MLPAIPMGLIAGIAVAYLLIPHGFGLWNVLWICPVVVALTYATVRAAGYNINLTAEIIQQKMEEMMNIG